MIDLDTLYRMLKKDGFEIGLFRVQVNESGHVEQRLNISDLKIYPDAYLRAVKDEGSRMIFIRTINPSTPGDERSISQIIKEFCYKAKSVGDLDRFNEMGLCVMDWFHNSYNLVHPDVSKDGRISKNVILHDDVVQVTFESDDDVPKTELDAAKKLVELGQPIEQFEGKIAQFFLSVDDYMFGNYVAQTKTHSTHFHLS